jgi:SAM-dependent methyltransferase
MHLLSAAQWQRLLGAEEAPRLLDVGAGDGLVTHALAQCFSEVTATETSAPMVRRLRARGFASYLLDVTHHPIPGAPYDAISLLNVLDRCASPLSLLASVRKALTPRGRLILALVVPYRPFFFSGRSTPSPIRPLPLTDTLEFEVAARRVCDSVLEPAGFIVESLARAPYLSWGDSRVAIYELDALVIVARRRPAERAEAPPGATD